MESDRSDLRGIGQVMIALEHHYPLCFEASAFVGMMFHPWARVPVCVFVSAQRGFLPMQPHTLLPSLPMLSAHQCMFDG